MVLSRFLGALARRWYVLLIGLLATAGAVYVLLAMTSPAYNARGLVLLLPSDEAVGEGGNPLLVLGGLDQPANLVVAQMSGASLRAEIEELAPGADFAVYLDTSTRGPVIAVEATARDPDDALKTQQFLTSSIATTLARLQDRVGAPPESKVTSMPLIVDDVPEADTGPVIRAVILAVIGGVALSCLAAAAVDGLMGRARAANPTRGNLRREDRARGESEPTDDNTSAADKASVLGLGPETR